MKSIVIRVCAFAAMAVLLSCFSSRPVAGSGTAAEGQGLGSFSITSKMLGDQTFTPGECTGGDRQFFLGADLEGQASPLVLRLVVDPLEGPAVRLFSADAQFDKSVVFHRSDCRVFHFSLDSTGWRINDDNDYSFTLQLECAREGETIRGTASSAHCH
jgi:hypothetical protein